MLARDQAESSWRDEPTALDEETMKRQATYLTRAEHQLLDEGQIESVDQS